MSRGRDGYEVRVRLCDRGENWLFAVGTVCLNSDVDVAVVHPLAVSTPRLFFMLQCSYGYMLEVIQCLSSARVLSSPSLNTEAQTYSLATTYAHSSAETNFLVVLTGPVTLSSDGYYFARSGLVFCKASSSKELLKVKLEKGSSKWHGLAC